MSEKDRLTIISWIESTEKSREVKDVSESFLNNLSIIPNMYYDNKKNDSIFFEFVFSNKTTVIFEVFVDEFITTVIPFGDYGFKYTPKFNSTKPLSDLSMVNRFLAYISNATKESLKKNLEFSENKETEEKSSNVVEINNNEKKSWWKKILFGILFIFGAILAIFIKSRDSISELNQKIKESKEKDKELQKKAEKIQEDIDNLEKETEKVEEKIQEKENDFNNFVEETKKETQEFEKKKEEIANNSSDLEANVDWVKAKFGGSVKIND